MSLQKCPLRDVPDLLSLRKCPSDQMSSKINALAKWSLLIRSSGKMFPRSVYFILHFQQKKKVRLIILVNSFGYYRTDHEIVSSFFSNYRLQLFLLTYPPSPSPSRYGLKLVFKLLMVFFLYQIIYYLCFLFRF